MKIPYNICPACIIKHGYNMLLPSPVNGPNTNTLSKKVYSKQKKESLQNNDYIIYIHTAVAYTYHNTIEHARRNPSPYHQTGTN